MTSKQIPSFGNWEFCHEVPITHYFETDLFKVPPSPLHHHYHKPRKASEKRLQKLEQRKQAKAYDVRSITPKAVDEDLYKIPPEFLHKKPKKRVGLCDVLKRCLGLSCIA